MSLAFFFILSGVAEMIDNVLRVTWGHIIDPGLGGEPGLVRAAGCGARLEGPAPARRRGRWRRWLLLLVVVIERKLRPVEVVS